MFNRLGPIKPVSYQDENQGGHKRDSLEAPRPSKRMSVDASDIRLFLDQSVKRNSSIKINYTPLNKESLNEVTNKPQQNQPTNRPSARVQTTNKPAAIPIINQPPPFKLIPVLPPNKNRSVNIKDGQIKQQESAQKINTSTKQSKIRVTDPLELASSSVPVNISPAITLSRLVLLIFRGIVK